MAFSSEQVAGSTPDERLAVQTRMLVDEIRSQNASDHEAMRKDFGSMHKSLLQQVAGHTRKWAVGAALVGFVGVALPVYSQIRVAYADDHVRAVAAETARQEALREKVSRAEELKQVADLAARGAVQMVTLPTEKITR